MRPRDLARLASTPYDVLVIGGGIHGLACAYEAASRGLSIALLEAGDYGGASSFNHQKTVHGGLRALQSLSLRRAREGIRERRAVARMAPWLLRPLPFVTPTGGSVMRSRAAFRAAFLLDSRLGYDRNAGVEPELHLPAPRLLSQAAARRLLKGVRQHGLTGAAQWHDYQMVENDRLTVAVAAAADRAGADLANHVEVQAVLRRGGAVAGARALDRLTGSAFEVRSRALVNAAGAAAGRIMEMFGAARSFPLLKAMNLVTTRPAGDLALAAPAGSGRMLTQVPWRGRAIVGTWQAGALALQEDGPPTRQETDAFLAEANEAFPPLALDDSAVALVHWGLVPAVQGRRGPDLLPASRLLWHRREGTAGAVTIVGAKYTTARATAERTVDGLARELGIRIRASRTSLTPLPGAGLADHEGMALDAARRLGVALPPAVLAHLARLYGEHAVDVVRLAAERPDGARPIGAHGATIGAEVLHAIRHEHACRLADIVLRRTAAGAAGHPGADAVAAAADLAAAELGWDEHRRAEEVAALERTYRVG